MSKGHQEWHVDHGRPVQQGQEVMCALQLYLNIWSLTL